MASKVGSSNQSDPSLTYTLDQFISMKHVDEITYINFSILERVKDNLVVLDHNIIDDYMNILNNISVLCEITDEQYKKYRFSPDLLAYDVYGSTQLDFIILLLNDMVDPKEFDLKKIKLPYASKLKAFLSEVYNAEYEYLHQNRADNNLSIY